MTPRPKSGRIRAVLDRKKSPSSLRGRHFLQPLLSVAWNLRSRSPPIFVRSISRGGFGIDSAASRQCAIARHRSEARNREFGSRFCFATRFLRAKAHRVETGSTKARGERISCTEPILGQDCARRRTTSRHPSLFSDRALGTVADRGCEPAR